MADARQTGGQGGFAKQARRARCVAALLGTSLAIGACGGGGPKPVHSVGDSAAVRPGPAAGQSGYKVGKPYRVDGVYYHPAVDYGYSKTGIASWYGSKFHGKPTANGEVYDMNALTAAHKTLPMPSIVRVTNLENGRAIDLRINDRGPFVRGRIIDVSRRGAQLLGFRYKGTARVRVEILADESRRFASLAASGKPLPQLAETSASAPATRQAGRAEPVRPNALYVQAGSFVDRNRAAHLRTRLARHGTARVVAARVGNQRFFRVMIGPFQDLALADRTLALVAGDGYPRARLVVDRSGGGDAP